MSIWILLLIAFMVVIAMIPKGTRGEMAVIVMQKIFLDSKIYIDINDVTIQTPTGTTQIDHIIVSKFGIFVIETKNMSGWIFGSPNQAQWTQSLPGGNKFRFQNPLRQNYKHTKSLEEFLGVDHNLIHSVVLFVGDTKFKTEMPDNVLDGGYIPYIKSKSRVLFMDDEVAKMVVAIRSGMMPRSTQTRREHIESLSARHDRENN
jgi:restriction system protein